MTKVLDYKLSSYKDLVTTHEQTRAGFIAFALEKNRRSTPFIEEAKSLKVLASKANTPEDLLHMSDIRSAMITASGLSDKALNYFTDSDKDKAINELIEKFLKPAGNNFIDELVYRFLLIRGDSLGGQMRNVVGALAQQKLVRSFISVLSIMGIPFRWYNGIIWQEGDYTASIEYDAKAIYWNIQGKDRILAFNLTVAAVKNNVDICLFDADIEAFANKKIAQDCIDSALMFGELKGGIDPAGADEHWKTGNSALERIRVAFHRLKRTDIKTAFIAAAIEDKMGREIFEQIKKGTLSFGANITIEEQLVSFCKWTINL
jgi:type II restriction enzyme